MSSTQACWVAQLELGEPRHLSGVGRRPQSDYGEAQVLVRLHGDPIGFLRLAIPAGQLTTNAVADMAWSSLSGPIREHLALEKASDLAARDGLGTRDGCSVATGPSSEMPISVVLCTRNRPELVHGCLQSLRDLRYQAFEVVLVDNAPDSDATQEQFTETVGDDGRFRYVREPVPGLSRARNRGLAEATSAHVAFTDDDAIADPWWLHGIARGFDREPSVGCVTGIVPAACLDNEAQQYFDERVTWSKSLRPRVWAVGTSSADSPLFPFAAGAFGTGANFAVDRDLALATGGFDEALGAGSPSQGGEDLDMFVRVLRLGRSLAYEPSAVVWHFHRTDSSELRKQMRAFGIGLGAYLTKQFGDRATRGFLVRQAPRGAMHMVRHWRRAGNGGAKSASLVWAELAGLALGPIAYRRGRHGTRPFAAPRA